MRRSLIRIAVVGAACGLALSGCGAPADEPATTPPAAATPPGATGPPPTFAPPPPTGPPEHGWEGTVEVDFGSGEVAAPGFNDLIDDDRPDWARDPLSTVTVLLLLDELEGDLETSQQTQDGNPVVVVTNSGIGDDSVAAIRYRIVLEQGDDGLHRFAAGEAGWRCQPERGHQDFSVEPCT
jgi:hypothetical protein